jgi:uncharacterized protein
MSLRSGSRPPRPAASSADLAGAPPWIEPVAGGVVLRVHAQPGAARTRIAGRHGDAVKVQVHARPVDGAANRELVALVAAALAVRPAAVSVVSGAHGREKRLRVEGVDVALVTARLAPFVDKAPGAD